MPFALPLPRHFRTQLALSVALLVGVLALTLSAVLGELGARQARVEESRALTAVAQATARALADGLAAREREVRVMAESPTLWVEGLDAERVRQAFHRSQAIYPHNAWIGVTDTAGVVRNATGDLLLGMNVRERPWFAAGLRGVHVGDVHAAKLLAAHLPPGSDGGPVRFVDFAAPVLGKTGEVMGVMAIHGSWEWAHATVASLLPETAAQRGLEVFIFDRQGELIYAPGRTLAALRQAHQTLPLRAEEAGEAQVLSWQDGDPYLTAAVALAPRSGHAGLGWTIVARLPMDAAFASARRNARLALGFGLLAAVFASALGAWMATHLTRPLHRMARAAQAIEQGDADARMPHIHEGSHEVQQLSATLASMTQRLTQAKAELEQRVAERTAALERANHELAQLARHDPLTGLLNRRGLDDRMLDVAAGARRRGTPVSVLVVDADHFKRINDRWGHDAGDAVLKTLAQLLKQRLRALDVVARIGGEEFVAVLPDTDGAAAASVARALVERVAAHAMPTVGQVTISVGATVFTHGDEPLPQALRRADEALYCAKRGGRNRCEFVDGEEVAGIHDATVLTG